jgi:hypothetical protein
MRYRRYSKPQVRTITVKYAGPCACCGATIKAGEIADYYPPGSLRRSTGATSNPTGAIAHVGGLEGNSGRCAENIAKRRDPGFVDLDRMFEDQCADICGR